MQDKLKVLITSFSFKNGVPLDPSGNGGGFVFDARCLPNPGREEQYKKLTGLDGEVINFLERDAQVIAFINEALNMAEFAINNYLQRNFTHLMVSFGCTGGQHRSVYLASEIAKAISKKFPQIILEVVHRDIPKGDS